ncbi:toprim domain-containing protein [Rhynchospora pubera]|uniref:Toprim domain-containing protein n=1 Tax=Rhynchospora pubera TaxID=906938 RepID=A0AAV8G353_9POAL|nr:toprim domain-containing protein [Rhynchospora pubera]
MIGCFSRLYHFRSKHTFYLFPLKTCQLNSTENPPLLQVYKNGDLSTNRSLMPSSTYSRLFHLSSIRAPLSLHQSILGSKFLFQRMKLCNSFFSYPVLPYSTFSTSLIRVNQREPTHNFVLNCMKQAESRPVRSVRPFVSRRKVHTDLLSESDHEESPQRSGNSMMSARKREDELQERLVLLRDKLLKAGIQCYSYKAGQYGHMLCPQCLGGSTMEKSLSLNIDTEGRSAVWKCFKAKCGWSGYVQPYASDVFAGTQALKMHAKVEKQKHPRKITEQKMELQPLCSELLEYFKSRGISAETLRRNLVLQKPTIKGPAIAFTYRRNGTLVSCKYRQTPKTFWKEANTEKIFYGLDDIANECDIIIVEGEIDKLSIEEAGFKNCVSVPDGAPPSVSNKDVPAEDQDTKYQYLWNCKEYLKSASRIILATDADGPGQALAEELARRLGKERCWRVKWPMKNDEEVFKDANEVLFYSGKEALREVIENAEMYPIRGLFTFSDFSREIDKFYDGNVIDLGISTGWEGLDKFYKVMPGELTVVSGVPNSGKSEWIDALMVNLNHSIGWKFVLCSMENMVRDHARKLLEKHIGKPFFDLGYGANMQRMSKQELVEGKKWLNDSFYLIRCEDDVLPSVQWVLRLAKAAVMRHGVRGLVIDPYNELDHQRASNQTETEYVSQILTQIKRFAQHHSCHVWFVAHPRQLQNWNGSAPNLYDISGSAHFINKCDNGIVIHRNHDPKLGPIDGVTVHVRKVRNKVIGRIGECQLTYDRVTGEYSDYHEQ